MIIIKKKIIVIFIFFLGYITTVNGKNISSNIKYFINIYNSPIMVAYLDPESPGYLFYISNKLSAKTSSEYLLFGIYKNNIYYGISTQILLQLDNFTTNNFIFFPWQLLKAATAIHTYILLPLPKIPYYSIQNQLSFFHESRYVSDNERFIQNDDLFWLAYRENLYPIEYIKYKFIQKFQFQKIDIIHSIGLKVFYKPILFLGTRYTSFAILQEIEISYSINHHLKISIKYYYEFQDIQTLILEDLNNPGTKRIIESAQYHILDISLTLKNTNYKLSPFFQYNFSNGRSFDFIKHYGHIYGLGFRILI